VEFVQIQGGQRAIAEIQSENAFREAWLSFQVLRPRLNADALDAVK
jgi:hypothetical protein